MAKEWIVVHHSAGPRSQKAGEISAFLRRPKSEGGRGFKHGAYAKIIEEDGSVHDDAPETETRVAHAVGFNTKGIGVCLTGFFDPPELIRQTAPYMGDYPGDQASMDHPQIKALIQTLVVLCLRHRIPASHIISHHDTFRMPGGDKHNTKSCCGNRLRALLPQIRQKVASYLTVKT